MNKANKEETALAIKEQAMNKLMANEGTGIDTGDIRYRPNIIKILQSDKQQKYFKEGVEISTSDYGKLFLSIPDVTIDKSKLIDSFEGTIMRYGLGFNISQTENDNMKFIGSAEGMIGAQGRPMTKEQFETKYPKYDYKNIARFIFCIGTPEEVLESVAIGGNPFASLDLSGSSYGVSFSVFDKMSAAIQNSEEWKDMIKQQRANGGNGKPTANAFKIKITSEQQVNQKGQKFYIPKIEIEANEIKDALLLQPMFEMWKNYSLFGSFGKDDVFDDKDIVEGKIIEEDKEDKEEENFPWSEKK